MDDPARTWQEDQLLGSGDNSTVDVNISTSLTCQQIHNKEGLPLQFSATFADIIRYSQIVYFLTILPLGVFMNTLVIALVARFKRLKTATFYLALQLIIVDLLNAAILFPSSTANAIAKTNILSDLCSITGAAIFFLCSVRTFIMSVLVTDRFCSVFMPFWYPRNRVKLTVTLSLLAWITALILSIVPSAKLLDCYGFQQYTWTCTMSAGCTHKRACTFYNTFTIIFMQATNLVALTLYFMMYCKARKLRNRIEDISQVQQQSLEARSERQRQERRANMTFFLLFLALIGVSLPDSIFNQASNLHHISATMRNVSLNFVIQFLTVLAQTLHCVLVIIDPVVILRDKDAKEVMLKCISKVRRSLRQREQPLRSHQT